MERLSQMEKDLAAADSHQRYNSLLPLLAGEGMGMRVGQPCLVAGGGRAKSWMVGKNLAAKKS